MAVRVTVKKAYGDDDMNRVEELLTMPCWIIDVLPERVTEKSPGQYTAVEKFFLQDPALRQKQLNIILKLNCYYDLTPAAGNEGTKNPAPAEWAARTGREYLNILVGEDALITIDHTDTYMTVFTADEKILTMVRKLAASEGLFVWKGND